MEQFLFGLVSKEIICRLQGRAGLLYRESLLHMTKEEIVKNCSNYLNVSSGKGAGEKNSDFIDHPQSLIHGVTSAKIQFPHI